MSNVFELFESTPEQVIVKVNAKDPLNIARHPYLESTYAYITVTRGHNHVFTVIKNDGTTWSFSFGSSSYTLIADSVKALKEKVLDFIDSFNIAIDCKFDFASHGEIFYNKNYGCWEIVMYGNGERGVKFFYDLKNQTDADREAAFERAEQYGLTNFQPGTCATGIPVWKSHND